MKRTFLQRSSLTRAGSLLPFHHHLHLCNLPVIPFCSQHPHRPWQHKLPHRLLQPKSCLFLLPYTQPMPAILSKAYRPCITPTPRAGLGFQNRVRPDWRAQPAAAAPPHDRLPAPQQRPPRRDQGQARLQKPQLSKLTTVLHKMACSVRGESLMFVSFNRICIKGMAAARDECDGW